MKKIIITLTIIVLILTVSVTAEQEISANSMKYIYSKSPNSYPIGSWICFDYVEEKICAPLLGFYIDEINNQEIEFIIKLKENIDVSGEACIVNSGEHYTWNQVMNNLKENCRVFEASDDEIHVVLDQESFEQGLLRIVFIPNSGSGNVELESAKLIVYNETIQEPEPPTEPDIPDPGTPIETCNVKNIYFSKQEQSVNLPVELTVETENCENSVIRLKIIKKGLTDNIISNKQAVISENKINILWVAEQEGEYYATAESENLISSGHITIKKYSLDELLENKKFNDLIGEVYKVAKVDKKTAIEICEDMPTSLETDICLENVAIYIKEKGICSRINDKKRKESCYVSFALYGDVSGCINSESKISCIMLGLLSKNANISLGPKDKYENSIIMNKKEINTKSLTLIILIITAIILFLITEFLIYKKKKKSKK